VFLVLREQADYLRRSGDLDAARGKMNDAMEILLAGAFSPRCR